MPLGLSLSHSTATHQALALLSHGFRHALWKRRAGAARKHGSACFWWCAGLGTNGNLIVADGGWVREARALEMLRLAAANGPVALATSLSAEDMVLTDLIARHNLPIGLFALDTGMLHDETLAMIAQIEGHYSLRVRVVTPDAHAVQTYIDTFGKHGFYESVAARVACCDVRKVAPLGLALTGLSAWVTGQRREQATSRAALAEIEPRDGRGLIKYNPLADWSWQEVLDYVARHNVPHSPLYARGYVSIGCATCTRALKPGEDPRAARWWWEDNNNKECGLHVVMQDKESVL
ncbi:MAG: Phosphoadenosine phosphosulfate reductase [Pseudomonadota bacterium]